MGGAVIGADAVAAVDVDAEVNRIADIDAAGADLRPVGMEAAERLGGVLDVRDEAGLRTYGARVAHLAAAFAVERRLVGDDQDRLSGGGAVEVHTVLHDGHDLAFALGRAVADELGVAGLFRDIEPDFVRRLFARRSDERRVGKESVSTYRYRWAPF